jgi:hypothetical protein
MKIIFFTIVLGLCSVLSFAQQGKQSDTITSKQQLVGIWQQGSPTIADALRKSIQFFADGSFLLNYSQYDDITAVRSLGGHYKLDSSGLFLAVEYRKEIVGGDYERGNPGVQSEEFILTGGKLEVIKQKPDSDSFVEPFIISGCKGHKTDSKHMCMLLNYNTYYKLSSNPNAYETRKKPNK